MDQEHQAIGPGVLELLELPSDRITLRASSFDVLVCQLVLLSNRLGGIGNFALELLDATLELLDSQLEDADAIGSHQALGDDVPCLFFVSLAEETKLVFHGSTTLVVVHTRLGETPERLPQVVRSAERLVVRITTGGTNSRPADEGTAGGIPPGGPACAPNQRAPHVA